MTTDPTRLEAGALFEWHVVVEGVPIELLAEVEVSGSTLHLLDVAVFPVGVERADLGLRPLMRAARSELFPVLRAAGFSRLRVTATRLSGASPGRIVDLTIDLERQAR